MKLYEFDYIDNQKLSPDDLHTRIEKLLITESEVQLWAPDYVFRQYQPVEQLSSGEMKYSFEVIGRYLDSDSLDFMSDVRSSDQPAHGPAAKDANP